MLDSFQQNDLGQKHWQNTSRFSLRFDGVLSPNWTFHSFAEANTDKGDRDYPPHYYEPADGLPYNPQGNGKRTYDAFTARTDWRDDWFGLSAGVDHISWGPARRNKLVFRGNDSPWRPWNDTTLRLVRPAPFPFLGFSMELGPVTYQQFTAKLEQDKDKNKFVHAHRLDFQLPYQIRFGLSETEVYGSTVEPAGSNPNHDGDSTGRSLEVIYMLPFVPYVFAQHYVGDRDNTGLAGDISIRTLPGWEFYGELLWDDMKSPLAMWDDSWWGNKWAASVGLSTTPRKLGSLGWEWMAEHTHIEPWVYTHHMGASHRYTHFNQSLDSDLGPNSRETYTQLALEWKKIRLELHASAVDKDTAKGGHLEDIHITSLDSNVVNDPTDKTFLNNASTFRYTQIGAVVQWNPVEYWWVRFGSDLLSGHYSGTRFEASSGLTW